MEALPALELQRRSPPIPSTILLKPSADSDRQEEDILAPRAEIPTPVEESLLGDLQPQPLHRPDNVEPLTRPWWASAMSGESLALNSGAATPADHVAFVGRSWELEQLIWLAVQYSPYIQAEAIAPRILQSRAMQASGEFDASTFVDSIFHDTSDPVGNELLTGGNGPRLNENLWENRAGIRGKNTRGGRAELFQEFLFHDSNSAFFVPSNQADSTMMLRYTQPLIRGRGEAYNRSSIVIANLQADQSSFDVSQKIQEHAFRITRAYWELYAARAAHAQIEAGLKSLRVLRRQLSGRADLNGLRSQLLRCEAAIANQEANLAHALAGILSAEAELRAAVGAPELRDRSLGDVIPSTPTADWASSLDKADQLSIALDNNPQIRAIHAELRAARVRLQVAEHELRPTLDLVLESYVRGLTGNYNGVQSFGNQFSTGAPSYAAGVTYLRPYRNITAQAILRERRLELRRSLLELDDRLLTTGAEVEGSLANVSAAFQRLESAVRSTKATHAEREYLHTRWQLAALDSTSTSLLLDQLLNAEIQLIQAENEWARAQADNMLWLAQLRLATGTLLPFMSSDSLNLVP